MNIKSLKEKIGLLYNNIGLLYNNKVSCRKESAVEYVRRKCDGIPPQKRFKVVAVAFALFALLALFVFGKSMYNIYNGVHSNPDFGTIKQMPMPDKGNQTDSNIFYGSEDPME